MKVVDAFSSSYAQARAKFLSAAHQAGLEAISYRHPLPGRDGETLALDVVLDGPVHADKLLLVSSACHGVEGHCGSGVQVYALHDAQFRARCAEAGVSVLYLHALNPYGFSHIRRATHENVDLNRNFQDFTRPLPSNAAYRALHPLLVPDHWPPDSANKAALDRYVAEHGLKSFQAVVTGGQYEIADGLFYGGVAPTWSNLTLRQVLREHAAKARQIGWIDLHTGLGETGHCERGFAGPGGDTSALRRARNWWGTGGATPVVHFGDQGSVSAPLTGQLARAVYEECPQAEITAIGLEFGTRPLLQVLHALRAEQWLTNHEDAPKTLASQIKQAMLDAFYVDTPDWKDRVVREATTVMAQAFQMSTANPVLALE